MRVARVIRPAFAAVSAAVLLAACGGSSTVTVTRTVTQAHGGGSTTTTAPSASTAATTTTSTQVASGTACNAADLTPSFLGSNGAAGTIVLGFALKNTGSETCHTYGWPGVEFLSSGGSALPTHATRGTSDIAGSTPASPLTLKPGEEASFRMTASDVPTGGGSCPTAAKLQIYAPDDTATMVVAVPGIAACGKATVSPMMAGDSAFAGQGGGDPGSGGSGSGSGAPSSNSGGGQTGVNGSNGSNGSAGSNGSSGSGGASVSG